MPARSISRADQSGLSAREIADAVGHSDPSTALRNTFAGSPGHTGSGACGLLLAERRDGDAAPAALDAFADRRAALVSRAGDS